MKFERSAVISLSLAAASAIFAPGWLLAQNPPPNPIFDLAAAHPDPLPTYTQFSTSFVADNTLEYVSFAFREVPAYFGFDDASVTAAGSTTNLLVDPGFESDTQANVYTNYPVGWGRFIQPVDTSAIGIVASNSSPGGCNMGANSGTYFWCDGSVQGYDGLYQPVALTPGVTYNVSFFVQDNSGSGITNPTIDMLVYAGDSLPDGSMTIGTPPPTPTPIPVSTTPEPASLSLLGAGVAAIGAARVRFGRRKV